MGADPIGIALPPAPARVPHIRLRGEAQASRPVAAGARASLMVALRLLLALVIAGLAPAPLLAQIDARAYQLKAAFLYRFLQFVEWPAAAWNSGDSVQICVAQPNPFGAELEALVRGESLRGKRLNVRAVASSAALDGCHLLFIGATASNAAALLAASRERPILTVGETDAFGGVITLKIINNRVRFEVNADVAQRTGLRMSSQLLAHAVAVRGGTP